MRRYGTALPTYDDRGTARWNSYNQPKLKDLYGVPSAAADRTPMPSLPVEVFLSYSAADAPLAAPITKELETLGISVWWDQRLKLGDKWAQSIREALDRATAVLVLVTPSSMESHWVTLEWSQALSQAKTVIPILVGGKFSEFRKKSPLSQLQAILYEPGNPASLRIVAQRLHELRNRSFIDNAEEIPDVLSIRKLVDLSVEQAFKRLGIDQNPPMLVDYTNVDQSLVFVITAFTDDLQPAFEAIQSAARKVGLNARRVKDITGDYRITDQILKMIRSARFIVADLTHERPNVYFELGFARGLNKTVVTIIRGDTAPHFDVQNWTYIKYFDSRPLEAELVKRFKYEMGHSTETA
jgi:hypothetical protein